MQDIFRSDYAGDLDDTALVGGAQRGERAALEALIRKHQEWIYNIALRMVGNPDDAGDVTQEILIKLITSLSSFQRRSSFRTWVYRIVVNHVLAMRRRVWERLFSSFERQAELIESLQESEAGRSQLSPVEEKLLLEETKTGCLTGMMLCLERRERIALILSTVFDASSALGGELLETTPENYRQVVSRARKRLGNFMNEKCGLMNENNPCRCARKIQSGSGRSPGPALQPALSSQDPGAGSGEGFSCRFRDGAEASKCPSRSAHVQLAGLQTSDQGHASSPRDRRNCRLSLGGGAMRSIALLFLDR
jgi:RNA polymerase sigma factor (sigma-70 family)